MNDERLNEALSALSLERFIPSERLVSRTKAAIRGRRLLQVVVFLSFCAQLAVLAFALYLLASPGVPFAARVCGGVSLCGYAGCVIVAAVAARAHLVRFFRRVEQLTA